MGGLFFKRAVLWAMPDDARPQPPLPWLIAVALAAGRGAADSSAVVVAIPAHHPALPTTLIAEADA